MKTLLIVYHSMTDGTRQMAQAACDAAQAAAEGEVPVRLLQAHDARPDDVLAADRTSSGERSAARARAAIPTAAAKQAAWELATTAGAQPNALLEGTVSGFSDPAAPAELLDAYRERYFAGIATMFQERSPAEAQTVAHGLFPRADPATPLPFESGP